nr:MAG TPA: hypothetical protein [Caudoviricetes sp.]
MLIFERVISLCISGKQRQTILSTVQRGQK